jgi:hypothetical protein
MPGHEDIRLIAADLEEIHRGLRDGGLSLDETVLRAGKAAGLYRKFREHFAKSAFHVTVLRKTAEGMVEEPFDGKALES